MKKTLLILTFFILSAILVVGCGEKKKNPPAEEVPKFSEEDFTKGLLGSFQNKGTLSVEGRYGVGYMYAESFSTDETGTMTNGSLQISGRAFDPSDMGDETVINGRTYNVNTNYQGNHDLILSNGSTLKKFYDRYYMPLQHDWSEYTYEDIDEENGRIILEETAKTSEEDNGKEVFVHEYLLITIKGNKTTLEISEVVIRKLTIKSHIDITDDMAALIEKEFGTRYQLADQINQELGDDYLKGIYSVEEFMADFKK